MDQRCGQAAGWTREHVGVLTRYECVPPETLGSMAVEAVAGAMRDAGIGWSEVDLLLDGSTCRHQPVPCNAAMVHHYLGSAAEGIPCLDVQGTCLGFVLALHMANALFGTAIYRHIVIVCSEVALMGVNWRDPESACLMGDGAAAAVLRRTEPTPTYFFAHETYSQYLDTCQIRGGGAMLPTNAYTPDNDADFRFAMDGPRLVYVASKHLPPMLDRLFETAGLTRDDVQVVPHQAAPRALALIRRRLHFRPERFHSRVAHLGNMIAASIPAVLHLCRSEGVVRRGDRVLLLGTSAGYSQAGLLFQL